MEYGAEHFTVEPGSRIRVTLEQRAATNAVYVQLKDFVVYEEGTHDLWVGNKNLQLRSRNYAYYMGVDEFWVYVTELHEENGRQYFELVFDKENTFSLQEIKVYEHEMNASGVEKRREHILESLTIKANTIEGMVETKQEELLFLSVPYSRGWKAYVDGEETEIHRANVAFTAIEIPGGIHSIYLKYETPGLKAGAVISGICMILSIIMLRDRRKNGNLSAG